MEDIAIGRLIMLARQRRQWRQDDLAAAAGVSRALVALAEAGGIERLTVRSLRQIGAPLEIRLPFAPQWNGGEVDRLRDRDHARLVDQVTAVLGRRDWEVIVEHTFSHYGERGSMDIVGWHAAFCDAPRGRGEDADLRRSGSHRRTRPQGSTGGAAAGRGARMGSAICC